MSNLVGANQLQLPTCPLPRPEEDVCWYAGAARVSGKLLGHDSDGQAVITTARGVPTRKRYAEIRLSNPAQRQPPNWSSLPVGGKILRPDPHVSSMLRQLLSQRVPPGPKYYELIEEIWYRGFEVFVVGGTVRDAIAARTPNDVDIATTMPLFLLKQFLPSMYRYDPSAAKERGYVRIGGKPQSGDPFIDVKVFSDNLPGTKDALFGADFALDVGFRDFACNSVYYDPINNVLIDPTGHGVTDAAKDHLTLICCTNNVHQHAQILIRAIKFMLRGYTLDPTTLVRLTSDFAQALPAMHADFRIRYFRAQVLSKCASPSLYAATVQQFEQKMVSLGLGGVWDQYFKPFEDRLAA